jgi:hypothetical protein
MRQERYTALRERPTDSPSSMMPAHAFNKSTARLEIGAREYLLVRVNCIPGVLPLSRNSYNHK